MAFLLSFLAVIGSIFIPMITLGVVLVHYDHPWTGGIIILFGLFSGSKK